VSVGAVNLEAARNHGLSDEEYARILEILGRTPTLPELGIFSVMWSEHCSYKSSKRWLATMPTKVRVRTITIINIALP